MKPAFALSFSENGISLHHQSDGDWYCIGTVPLDAQDFSGQMQTLRDQGFALENDLSCKLFIPSDQVRLLTVDTDGLDEEAAQEKVRATLSSATPYDLSELAYVAIMEGSETRVAAVAQQTLNEASTFAVDHGFIPEAFWVSASGEDALTEPVHELPLAQDENPPIVMSSVPQIEAPEPEQQIDPQVLEIEASEPEIETFVSEPEMSVSDIEVSDPEPETSEPEPEAFESEPRVSELEPEDFEPETEALESETAAPEPEIEAFEAEPELPELEPEAFEPETEAPSSEIAIPEPEIEAFDSETEVSEPDIEVSDPEPEASESETQVDDAEPEDTPDIPVHAIAGAAEPTEFRPAQSAVTPEPSLDVKRYVIPAVAASVVLGMLIGLWSLNRSDPEAVAPDPEVAEASSIEPELESASTPEPEVASLPPEAEIAEPDAIDPGVVEAEPDAETDLSATDEAILEALKVEPEPVEEIAELPDVQMQFQDFTGVAPVEPVELADPPQDQSADFYQTSVDRSDLSTDTIALPEVDGLDTDEPFGLTALASATGQQFELDERGLVNPSADGTLNPDGIIVYLGRPTSVPPDPPTRFETEPVIEDADDRLAGLRPRPRPENLVDQFERQQLGGRSREELASVRPKLRPESLQAQPQVDETPTALAVVRVPRPRIRPASITAVAAQKPSTGSAPLGSTANVASNEDDAGSFQPRSVSPKIPTTASVARQATIDNAINLRKLNLIGVYGTPANRRALVRLPSGRYKKLKVGDRIDGGNVVAIGDSELRYQKRGRNVTLKMPRG